MVSLCSRKSVYRGPDLEDEGGGAEETVDDGDEEGVKDTDEDEKVGVDEAPGGDEGEGVVAAPPPEDGAEDMVSENEGKKKSGERIWG